VSGPFDRMDVTGLSPQRMGLICIFGSLTMLIVVMIIRVKKPSEGGRHYLRPHLPGVTVMTILNNEWSDGVVFCRGPVDDSMGGVYLDADLTRPVAKSELDCSIEDSPIAQQWGAGVPSGTTLAFGLQRGQFATLYLHPDGTWPSGACWFQDAESNARVSMAKGPRYMSLVEFTIQESGRGQVFYDMSSVEGVSGGISMNYTDDFGHVQTDVAVPGKFSGNRLSVVSAPEIGFPTVLSDKNVDGNCDCDEFSPNKTSCNTAGCYAGCPGSLVDNPCGQHRCRAFYAKMYKDTTSYCGWLRSEKAQTYCWAMDEWMCVDETCGYGGPDEPKADCSTPLPPDAAANTYSCGHGTGLPGVDGSILWPNSGGCVDKKVVGVPTNPAPSRWGGRISISFEALPWLHEAMNFGWR